MAQIKKVLPFLAMVMGIVVAFATSAFTSTQVNKSGLQTYSFQFQPKDNPGDPADYSQARVENVANWEMVASPVGCDDSPQAACSIEEVPEQYVNQSTNELLSTINIQATQSSTDTSYVNAVDEGSVTITNRSL